MEPAIDLENLAGMGLASGRQAGWAGLRRGIAALPGCLWRKFYNPGGQGGIAPTTGRGRVRPVPSPACARPGAGLGVCSSRRDRGAERLRIAALSRDAYRRRPPPEFAEPAAIPGKPV
jgi:hypothetical protein